MHAAHEDGHALGAKLVGNFVSAVDVTRHRRNPDEVRPQIEVIVSMFSSVSTTSYGSREVDAATASKPASGEYSARLIYSGRVVAESGFGLMR